MDAALERSARELSRFHEVFRYHHPAKGLRWLEIWSEPVAEAGGGVTWHGYMADVTAERRALEELHRSEERFRALIDRSTDMIQVLDALAQRQVGTLALADVARDQRRASQVAARIADRRQADRHRHQRAIGMAAHRVEALDPHVGTLALFVLALAVGSTGFWRSGEVAHLALAGGALAGLVMTKNEGSAIAVGFLAVTALFALARSRRERAPTGRSRDRRDTA